MSNSNIAISVENLAKSYLIGHQAAHKHETFREMMARSARKLVRSPLAAARGRVSRDDSIEEFWALKDVSFEVRCGEVLGVVGRNGAGKSTLLKILSRITEPTRGRAVIRGRVASLLEVGTGFHPDLTGRENIFLNGAILGMTRAEIKKKFDEIVAFAEVEKFLDTPVKRYSSGMYVRLAFAVAAHLEPEILVIDEVLAVGDVAFQRKCLGKMQNVAASGRTVLFVSHNLPAVVDLTARTLLLDGGALIASGPSREVVSRFLQMMQAPAAQTGDLSAFRRAHRTDGYVDIESVRVCGALPGAATVEFGGDLTIDVDLAVHRPVEEGIANIVLFNEQFEPITALASADAGFVYKLAPGRHTIHCNAGPVPLIPGEYRISIGVAENGGKLAWDVLEVLPGFRIDGTRNDAWMHWPGRPGVVLLEYCEWRAEDLNQGLHEDCDRQTGGSKLGIE